MRIEHIAFQVPNPAAMADWYTKHFGFVVKRGSDVGVPVRFLADDSGQVILELYNNSSLPMPNYFEMNPLTMHIALECPNHEETVKNLVADKATLVTAQSISPSGDTLSMLRDPWGIPLQLVKRSVAIRE